MGEGGSTPSEDVGDQTNGMVDAFDHREFGILVEVVGVVCSELLNPDGAGSVLRFGSDDRHARGVVGEHFVQDVEVHRVRCG